MKDNLIILIEKIINLLNQCGYSKNAKWYENYLNVFIDCDIGSNKFQNSLIDVKDSLGGMGSFSDLSMIPIKGISISENEARELQWDLSEELYEEINNLMKN